MNSAILAQVASISFSLLTACMVICLVSGLVLFYLRPNKINNALKHPYLQQRAFSQFPWGIRSAITLDYFFRLTCPGLRFWVMGNANKLLAHINPKEVPLSVKWPIVGFWGACWLGLIAMVVLWIMLLLVR